VAAWRGAFAAILILAAAGIWLATGANRGWTKTSVPVKRTDEVTGLTVDDYQKRFVPGLDFLGAALLGSGILAGASFLFRKRQTQTLKQKSCLKLCRGSSNLKFAAPRQTTSANLQIHGAGDGGRPVA
jgi:hypothetical protein